MRPVAPIAAALVAACTATPRPPAAAVDLAIRDVTVVDVEAGRLIRGRTVLVDDGRIAAVLAANDRSRAERTLDGRGAFLVPGLVDAHVHLRHAGEDALGKYLALGVTTMREMNGRDFVLRWRDEIASGARVGPNLVVAAPTLGNFSSPKEGWPTPATREEGARYVDRFATEGYDLVKIYTFLPRDAFLGIAERARARGVKVAGHAPLEVGMDELLASGLWSLEHFTGIGEAIATPESAALDAQDHRAVFHAVEVDEAKLRAVAEAAARHRVWQVPTLRYWDVAPPEAPFRAAWEDPALRALGLRTRLRILKAMHEAGAPIAVGTDSDAGDDVPVETYWEELELMQQAGVPAADVLEAATTDALAMLGVADRGEVRDGLVADLVLVRCDPLREVGCVREPLVVIRAGRVVVDRRGTAAAPR